MQQQKKECGTNCIITAWAGCGFQPYTREAPFWLAAIEKFGQRDELAQAPVAIALQNSIQRGGERLATRDSPANSLQSSDAARNPVP